MAEIQTWRWHATVVATSPAIPASLRPAFREFWETGDEQALWAALARYRGRRRRQRSTYPARWKRP